MLNGKTPIHLQRWSPSDFQADEHVKLLKARRDWTTLTFYRQFLDWSFMAGGTLPADPEELAAVVEMPRKDVERALSFCLGRLIQQEGDRLFQSRVRRDIAAELEFRQEQQQLGRKGSPRGHEFRGNQHARVEVGGLPHSARPEVGGLPSGVVGSANPPAPAPAPTPASNARRLTPVGEARPTNPLVAGRRTDLERELLRHVGREAELTNRDGAEVMAEVTHYEGAKQHRLNPATMSDDRLLNSVLDARNRVKELERERGVSAKT